MTPEFMECDTCRAKPGTPLLCAGCLHNRKATSDLRKTNAALESAIESLTQGHRRAK